MRVQRHRGVGEVVRGQRAMDEWERETAVSLSHSVVKLHAHSFSISLLQYFPSRRMCSILVQHQSSHGSAGIHREGKLSFDHFQKELVLFLGK